VGHLGCRFGRVRDLILASVAERGAPDRAASSGTQGDKTHSCRVGFEADQFMQVVVD
jgi:hypothetical protein